MRINQPMTKKNIFLIIILFLLILSGFRVGWILYHKTPDHPPAEMGVIDLSNWTFDDKQTITLDGEWEFYPNQFLDPKSVNNLEADESKEFISVPGDWRGFFSDKDIPTYGYGTYKLKIILPDDDTLYGIRMNQVKSAATIYKDGELISKFNQPTKSANKTAMYNGPFYTLFHAQNNEIEFMLHVSNYEIPFWGGITQSAKIGTAAAIHKESTHSKTLQIIVATIFLVHAMYTFYRYSLRKDKSQKDLLYYAIMLTIAGFAILIDDYIVLQLPVQVETYYKILLFLFLSTLFFMLKFINHLFRIKSKFFRVLAGVFIFIVIGELIIPFQYFTFLGMGVAVFYVLSLVYLFI